MLPVLPAGDVGDVVGVVSDVVLAVTLGVRALREDVEGGVVACAVTAFAVFLLKAKAVAVGVAPGVDDEKAFFAYGFAAGADAGLRTHDGDSVGNGVFAVAEDDQLGAINPGRLGVTTGADAVGLAIVVFVAGDHAVEGVGAAVVPIAILTAVPAILSLIFREYSGRARLAKLPIILTVFALLFIMDGGLAFLEQHLDFGGAGYMMSMAGLILGAAGQILNIVMKPIEFEIER